MDELNKKKCIPCQAGEPKLQNDQIQKYLTKVNGWYYKSKPDKIIKELQFKDFNEAVIFFNKVAKLAEYEGHHPDISIYSYYKLRIELWTHKIGGLHENDFIMAAKIDKLI